MAKKYFIRIKNVAIAKAKGTYKGRMRNSIESKEKFLSKYPTVVFYLNKKNPPTLNDIAKLCRCSKNTVQKVKKTLK